MLDAPITLDEETRIEWLMWVGRRVQARCGVVGIVVGVTRKHHADSEFSLDPATNLACRRREEMEGRHWWATVAWTDEAGEPQHDRRDLSWLRPVDADIDTRVRRRPRVR